MANFKSKVYMHGLLENPEAKFLNGPFPTYFSFNTVNIKRSMVFFANYSIQTADLWLSEATALPTEPQPLPQQSFQLVAFGRLAA